MNKKSIVSVALIICAIVVQAHEFWLQPLKFVVKTGENITVNFRVGEDFFGEPWTFTKDSIVKVDLHHKNTVRDLKANIVEGTKNNLQTTLPTEGTYLLVLQSKDAYSDLEAEEFNAYLKKDELDDAYAQRSKTNTLEKNGTEFYSRYTKLLVQAGEKTDNTFRKEIGFPVEIIPEQNPYNLKLGDPVQFRILFQGKPLFGAKVRVWNFYNNRTTVQNIYSQQDGMISTHISNRGSWMVSFGKMIPSKNPKADWQSYWASLVFGVK